MITRISDAPFFDALDAFFGDDIVHTEFHDLSSTNMNGSAGAFVALGTGVAMPSNVKSVRLSSSTGTPFTVRVAASAGAAASASNKIVVNRGEDTLTVNVKLTAGDKLWIRSLVTTGATSGIITVNFMG